MSPRAALALVGAYGVIAVVTFGHAAANREAYERVETERCRALGKQAEIGCAPIASAPISGGTAALLWPLYWSWEAWS